VLPLALLPVVAACSSSPEAKPASPPRPTTLLPEHVENARIEKVGDGLSVRLDVRYSDGSTHFLSASLSPGTERLEENASRPTGVVIRKAPPIRLPSDWHLRALSINEPLERLVGAAKETAPLTEQEAVSSVFIEVLEGEKWSLVVHVPPPG